MNNDNKTQLVTSDTNRIASAKNDMTSFCKLLNDTLSKLKEASLLFGNVDVELLREFACYETALAEKRLEEQARKEAAKLPPFQQRTLISSIEILKTEIKRIINELKEEVSLKRLSLGLSLAPYKRAEFITVENGIASFNEKLIEEAYTETLSGEAVDAYITEAKALFEQIRAFDRKTRLFSRNRVCGLCDNNAYKRGVIECYNGIIELDLTRLFEIDFTTDPAILESTADPGSYKITE